MIQVQKEGYCTAFKSFGSPQTLVKTPHIWVFFVLESMKSEAKNKTLIQQDVKKKYWNQCQKSWAGTQAGNLEMPM